MRDLPGRGSWERALAKASVVVAHASVLTEGLAEHATVVFPAESHAEKEGTIVHPDGRVQRLRSAIKRPGEVRAGWQVLADIAGAAGVDLHVLTAGMAFKRLVEAVPFYAGLTLEEIGGRGVRWPETEAAAAMPAGRSPLQRGKRIRRSPPAGPGSDFWDNQSVAEDSARQPAPRPPAARHLPLDLGLA